MQLNATISTIRKAKFVLQTLDNPLRNTILDSLRAVNKATIETLVVRTGLTRATLSQHLSILHQAGVISTKKIAGLTYYKVHTERVNRIIELCDMLVECKGLNISSD